MTKTAEEVLRDRAILRAADELAWKLDSGGFTLEEAAKIGAAAVEIMRERQKARGR